MTAATPLAPGETRTIPFRIGRLPSRAAEHPLDVDTHPTERTTVEEEQQAALDPRARAPAPGHLDLIVACARHEGQRRGVAGACAFRSQERSLTESQTLAFARTRGMESPALPQRQGGQAIFETLDRQSDVADATHEQPAFAVLVHNMPGSIAPRMPRSMSSDHGLSMSGAWMT